MPFAEVKKKCVSWDNTNFLRFYKEIPSMETIQAVCSKKQQEIYYIAWNKLLKYKIKQGASKDEMSLDVWLNWDKSRKCKD